jgi:hypothetical protein
MQKLLFTLAAITVVVTPVSAQYGNFGGSASGSTTQMDICPNGDYSANFYDGTCGTNPTSTILILDNSTTNTPVVTDTTSDILTLDIPSEETKPGLILVLDEFNSDTANTVDSSMNLPSMLPKT